MTSQSRSVLKIASLRLLEMGYGVFIGISAPDCEFIFLLPVVRSYIYQLASVNFRMLRSSNTMLRIDMKCANYRICKLPRIFPSLEWQVFIRSNEYCTNYNFLGMFEGLLYITQIKRCVLYYMPVCVCSMKFVSMYNKIWCKITSSLFPDPTRDLAA